MTQAKLAAPYLLFDLDGVLVHSYEAWRGLCRAAAVAFGSPPLSDGAFDAGWGQGIEADAESFFPGVSTQEIRGYYESHFHEHLSGLRYEAGAKALFETLADAGRESVICTNTQALVARAVIEAGGLRPTHILGTGPGLRSKPAPDLLLQALVLLGTEPARCWMIGDSDYDARAAEAAGIRFAGFRRPGRVELSCLEEALSLE